MATRVAVFYDAAQLPGNEFFLNSLVAAGWTLGAEVVPVVGSDALRSLDVGHIDVVIVRSRSVRERLWLQDRVSRVINSPLLALVGNDKLAQYLWCRDHELETPAICVAGLTPSVWVRKPRFGHGGRGVHLGTGSRWLCTPSVFVTQPYLPWAKHNRRHYVVGREVVVTVERSADGDFRSNLAMGAKIRLTQPTSSEHRFVRTIISLLGSGYYGIDVSTGPEGPVLMEIEDVVGSRALYALGHHDHALRVMRWVCGLDGS